MRSTFSTIFYLKRQVVKKDSTVLIMGRITVDETQTQFSCKLTIDPKIWETKTGRSSPTSSPPLYRCTQPITLRNAAAYRF